MNKDWDIKKFEFIKENFKDRKIVEMVDGKRVRESVILCLDNYFSVDRNRIHKKDSDKGHHKCRWDGKDTIWEYTIGTCQFLDFTICDNVLTIYGRNIASKTRRDIKFKIEDSKVFWSGVAVSDEWNTIPKMSRGIAVWEDVYDNFVKYINKTDSDFKHIIIKILDSVK